MKRIVVGDVHGNEPRFMELMDKLEVPASVADRQEKGIEVIQLGDFLNLGYGQLEVDFYEACRMYVDIVLIGNHELPEVAPNPQRVRFLGYEGRDMDAAKLYMDDFDNGRVHGCAYAVGDWLITHAGVSKSRLGDFIDIERPARVIADELNVRFSNWVNKGEPEMGDFSIFEDQGSIFWCRGLNYEYIDNNFHNPLKQIIGHTPQVQAGTPQSYVCESGRFFIIDIGAKVSLDNGIAALVTEDDGETWELHEVAGTHERGTV